MDAIEVLERQHRRIASMFSEIDQADDVDKEHLFDDLADELAVQIKVEAAHLVPAMQRRNDRVVKRALDSHENIRRSIAPLVGQLTTSNHLREQLASLESVVTSYVRWEQEELIPTARELVDAGQLELIGSAMDELEKETRASEAPRLELVRRGSA